MNQARRKQMPNNLCVVLALAAVASIAAQAQKANLSGSWKLNVPRSSMGGEHPFPDYQVTKKIDQKGDAISITDISVHNSVVNIPLPDSTTTMEVAADGKEHEVELPPPFPEGLPKRSGQPPAGRDALSSCWRSTRAWRIMGNTGCSCPRMDRNSSSWWNSTRLLETRSSA